MRYSLEAAERIRHELNLDPRQFSVRIEYDPLSYELALKRGYLTRRMAKEICRRWKIPISDFKQVEDGHQ